MSGKKVLVLTWILIFGAAAGLSAEEHAPRVPMTSDAVAGGAEAAPVEMQGVGNAVQMAQEEVRDPFQPQIREGAEAEEVAPKTEQAVKVVLQGVGFGAQDSYAILNGEIYYVEEERKGIKLVAVRKGEADVLVNGAMQTLRLFDEAAMRKSVGGRRKPKAPGTA